jgi:hypothetical protein
MRAGLLAPVLHARLRFEGRVGVADALASSLQAASIDCDPALRLPDEDDDSLADRNEVVARLRTEGWGERASRVSSMTLIGLQCDLVQRLAADGQRELADAIDLRCAEVEARGRERESARSSVSTAARSLPPEVAACADVGDDLARIHGAEILACATRDRLCADGRAVFAGMMMVNWVRDFAGPVAAPKALAAAFVARLRAEDRDELADEIEVLLADAEVDRDVAAIRAQWLKEVAGAVLDAGPLGAALVAALRREKPEGVADAVASRLVR